MILVQVENEYGSYGDDSEYIRYLADGLRRRGINVPLFTSDGTNKQMLTGGTVPEIFKTANFGSRAEEQFAALSLIHALGWRDTYADAVPAAYMAATTRRRASTISSLTAGMCRHICSTAVRISASGTAQTALTNMSLPSRAMTTTPPSTNAAT